MSEADTHGLAVFLVDELPFAAELVLDGPEGRHAAAVRRMRIGERLLISDGRGSLAECRVTAAAKDSLELRIGERWLVESPSVRVTLVQALLKGERAELAIEQATEAGVDRIVPWRASRCVTRWEDGPRGAKALGRWRSAVRESAKQARRPWIPEVTEPLSTKQLAAQVAEVVAAGGVALVLHEVATGALATLDWPADGEVLLVVGPEGGLSDGEVADLVEAGAVAVRLGPEVLRASTAGAVALGAIGVLTGRWAG
ncbi:16S rRNA (uracil(1498)-N(3))-methyltransferase [Pseudonocardiaceae bacterium YIM PH 21723]|nr:16S rRNA (uracil(1498)-N(3))-methyltransferase [Pseudonocardiaceae bacterium YIM PH 21723]